ncbi:MAG: DUF7601 domain-containing protein [Ruminococcus sp.]|jgi:pilin isopeptide linkage protein
MKRTKKLLAGIIAATMMFSMSATAFAADGSPQPQEGTVTITKDYIASNDDGVVSPADTFGFSISLVDVTDAGEEIAEGDIPVPTISDVVYAEGAAGSEHSKADIEITLPNYDSVGIYTYAITENSSNTAGVTTDTGTVYLKVTVTNQDGQLVCNTAVRKGSVDAVDKIGEDDTAFENKYEAGTLSIKKEVTGNLGDKEKYFEFKVTLTAPEGKNVNSTIKVGETPYVDNPEAIVIGQETTFHLKHGDTLNLSNIPYGVSYKVEEIAADKYETTVNGSEVSSAQDTFDGDELLTFVNDKTGDVDTGINMDSLPYILVFAGVAVIAAVMIVRRRRIDD